MTQTILQEFSADFAKFDKEVNSRIQLVAQLNQSASNINFAPANTSSYSNLVNELADINKNMSAINKSNRAFLKGLSDAFKLVDRLVKILDKYNLTLAQTNQLTADFINSLNGLSTAASNATGNLNNATTAANNYNNAAGNAANTTNNLNNSTRHGSGFFGGMVSSIQRLLPFLSALFVLNAVKEFIVQLYEVNKQFELFELKARAALDGSRSKVEEYYKALKRIDVKSLFDIEELEEGTLKLLNRRLKLTEAELQSLANTAEAVGTKGAQSFNQIVEALLDAQVGQFKRLEELGVGVDATGDKLKLTFAGVTTEVDKGSQAVVKYILNMEKMNGANKISEESAKTLQGRVSSLQTEFSEFLRGIYNSGGDTIFDILIEDASYLLKITKEVLSVMGKISGFTILRETIQNYNKSVEEDERDKGIIAGDQLKKNGFTSQEDLDRYRREVRISLQTSRSDAIRRFNSKDPITKEEFFDPGKVKYTDKLKSYANQFKTIIDEAKRVAINTGKDFDDFVAVYDAMLQEIEARRQAAPAQSDLDKKARQERAYANAIEKVRKDEEDALRKLNERKLELDKKYMQDRLRFVESGSDEYLELKKQIDLKEIEQEKSRTLQIVRETLVTRTVSKDGTISTRQPTDKQVNDRFVELGFEQQYNDARLQIEVETNEAISARRKELYDKITDFLGDALDREVKRINAKYDEIQKTIDKAKKDDNFRQKQRVDGLEETITNVTTIFGLKQYEDELENINRITGAKVEDAFVIQTDDFLTAAEKRIKALREYELALVRLQRSQEPPEISSRRVVRKEGEGNTSFNIRRQLTGKETALANERQKLDFTNDFVIKYPELEGNEAINNAINEYKNNIDTLTTEIENIKTNAKRKLNVQDEIIVKLFKIKVDNVTDGEGNIIGQVLANEKDKEHIEQFKKLLNTALNEYNSFVDGLIRIQQKREKAAEAEISRIKTQLDEEEKLRGEGLANSTERLKQELTEQQNVRADAQRKQIALQRQQIVINGILQASTLGLAVANIYAGEAPKGALGVAIATVASLSMLAIFAGIIAQLKALPSYGVGGYMDKGEYHSNGGIDVNVEKDEMIVRKESAKPNRTILENINKMKKEITTNNFREIFKNTGIDFDVPERLDRTFLIKDSKVVGDEKSEKFSNDRTVKELSKIKDSETINNTKDLILVNNYKESAIDKSKETESISKSIFERINNSQSDVINNFYKTFRDSTVRFNTTDTIDKSTRIIEKESTVKNTEISDFGKLEGKIGSLEKVMETIAGHTARISDETSEQLPDGSILRRKGNYFTEKIIHK